MKTTSSSTGNIFKRLILSLIVFMGLSVNAYSQVLEFDISDVNNTNYYSAYTDENNQSHLTAFYFDESGVGAFNEYIVGVDSIVPDVNGTFNYTLDDNGTITNTWTLSDGSCSGTTTYVLLTRETVEGINVLSMSGSGEEVCGTNPPEYDSFEDKLFLDNGTDDAMLLAINSTKPPMTGEEVNHNGILYSTIVSPVTGKVWLDRNLGANEVCNDLNDSACFGDYYQWGRNTDGHEKFDSNFTDILATDTTNAGIDFIIGDYGSDWITDNEMLRSENWSKTDGTSICPTGYRVPTINELNAEINESYNIGLFNSFLRIPSAGHRRNDNAEMTNVGTEAFVWATDYDAYSKSYVMFASETSSSNYTSTRTNGFSVRCIQDSNTTTDTLSVNPTDLEGSWDIYRGSDITDTGDKFGCADITPGVEIVHLDPAYVYDGNDTKYNTWSMNEDNTTMFINVEGGYTQNAVFNNINGDIVDVTCNFDNNWFLGLSSEPRTLVRVDSCDTPTAIEDNTTTPSGELNITTSSASLASFYDFNISIGFEDDDNEWFNTFSRDGNNFTGIDYEYDSYDKLWNIDDDFNGTVSINSDQNMTISANDGFVGDMIINSTEQITSIDDMNYSDLYVSQTSVTVIATGTGWEDTWDWAPTIWNGTTEIAITTTAQFLEMSLTNNNWFSDESYAMLAPSDTNLSGDIVEGNVTGLSDCDGDGLEDPDCKVVERTTNIIGSWMLTTDGIVMDLPNELQTLSIVENNTTSTGYSVHSVGQDKVGSVWNEQMLTGSDATVELMQYILSSSSSTPVDDNTTTQCPPDTYWDGSTCVQDGYDDNTTMPTDDVRIEKMIFSSDGTVQNFKFNGTMFDADMNETYGTDGYAILLQTDEGNETIKYNGTVSIDGLPTGLTAHEFCIEETSSKGIEYLQGILLEGNETELFSLKDIEFDLMKLGSDMNQTEFSECNANSIEVLYDMPLYMIEKNDYYNEGPSDDWQMSFPYQVVGNVNLPALGDDVFGVRMSAQPLIGYNWNSSELSKDEGNNSYVLGLNDGKYVLRLEINKDGGFEEYLYDANTTTWLSQQQVEYVAVDENGNIVLQENQDPNMYYNYIPNVTAVDTADFNSSAQTAVDFDLASLYGSFYTINGTVTVNGDFEAAEYCMSNSMDTTDIRVCEWNQGGESGYNNWVGANRININLSDASNGEHIGGYDINGVGTVNQDGTKTYDFTALLPKDGNYTIRVNKESYDSATSQQNWENFFFNPTTGKLVDEMNVQYIESDITDTMGNTMWIPDVVSAGVIEVKDVDGNKTANFGEINFASFSANQIKLNGTVTFVDADYVNIELINVANGNYFGWTEVKNSGDDFNITLPQDAGEYIIRLSKVNGWNWESYFYDVANSKFVMDNNIEWIESENGQWIPDVAQTGKYIVSDNDGTEGITQDDLGNPLNIDFTALDSQFYTVSGKVTVNSDFVAGELQDTSGNYIGWNNINFEVIDDTTGNYIGWFEIDRESNTTDTSGNKTYDYKIKLSNEGNYTLKVRYENQEQNQYENYFIDFANSTLINERDVQYKEVAVDGQDWSNWVPDFNSGLSLTESNKAQVFDVDFVALENSTYKLEGTIVVPDGFVPSNDWENYASIRVEAMDATTGKWLGDGRVGNTAVSGTTNTYPYQIKLSSSHSGDEIIVKLVKESQENGNWNWESYFIDTTGATPKLVSENTVDWIESNTTDDMGYSMYLPNPVQTGTITLDTNMTISLDINYDSLLTSYEDNKLSISGTIVLSESIELGDVGTYWNNIRVEAIDKTTGEWITSKDVEYKSGLNYVFNYEIDFAQAGSYIIKVTKEINGVWEEYYINFGTDHTNSDDDKIVNGQKVQWNEAEETSQWGGKNWMPDPIQTGYIELNAKIEGYDIDFSAFEDSIVKISGAITVADDFEAGDKYDENGNWIGYSNIRIEAINKTTGEYIASTNVAQKVANSDYYNYELKIGDTSEVGENFIIRITKESSTNNNWQYDELFINFGDNHEYDYDDKLVNGKRVQYKEAEALPSWGGNYKMWMPDFEQTGYITIGDTSPTGVNVDFTTLGQNDLKLSGIITFKADFNLTIESNEARVSLIDASTGMWVADTQVENNGTYELNLGDADEAAGDYIVQINYSHYDYSNWQDSWWKNKVVDFGTDNAYGADDEVLNDSDVQWKSIDVDGQEWGMWVPDVNTLTITSTVANLDFNLSVTSGGNIDGVITGIPSGASYPYAMIVNPTSYANNWLELKEQNDGTYIFNIEELKAADYTVEFGYEKDGKYYHYFIKDSDADISNGTGTVEGQDVRWTNLGNNVWGPDTDDTTYVTVTNGATLDLNIALTVVAYNSVSITLTGTEDDKYASADMNLPGKPFGRWEQNTTVNDTVSFTFDDVKDGTGYILNFWYENASYTCDGAACESLKKNAMWIAFDENNAQVCPKANDDWNCDWENSQNWSWKPDVTALTVSGDANLTVALPAEYVVSGALNLGADYAGSNVYVSIFQHNGIEYNWADFTLDNNGEVNSSMKIAEGADYRIELWVDGLGGYVYTASGWITQNNSWEENNTTHMWEPKASTLIAINGNLDLGEVTIGADLSKVTIVLENLDTDASGNIVEDVWVNLESNTNGYYGEGNANWEQTPVTYDGNITIKVPNGTDYKLSVFPMNHKGGYASNGDTNNNDQITTATKLSWSESDIFTVDGETTLTVTLPTAATLGEVNGTVVCDENNASANCSGWLDLSNGTDAKGTYVNSNGTFEIKGLDVGTYELNYWADSGLALNKSGIEVTANSVTTVEVTKVLTNMFESITGNVTAADLTGIYVVLIETNGTDFEVINTAQLDGSGNYSFGAMPKSSAGKAIVVAAAKRTSNADYSSSVKFDDAYEVYENGTVAMPTMTTEDFASSLSATANAY